MKEHILFVILVCAALGAGFSAGLYVGKDKTEDRYERAPHRRDTTRTVRSTPQPEQQIEVRSRPQLTPQSIIDADSVFQAGMQSGIDSVRRLFAYYTAPRETSIVFDSVGKLLHLSDRLRDMEIYLLQPFPRREVETTIRDTVFVPGEGTPNPWYDHWYIGALGTAATLWGLTRL